MKRILIFLFSLCLLPAQSQLLWQVSGHGLTRPSYLFGTHHLIPVSFLDSVPGLFRAFNRCDAVVGEMVMNNIDDSEKIMQASTLPQGVTMDSLLNAEDYALVDAGLRTVLQIGLKELALMKPAAIRTMYETELYRQYTGFDDDTQSDSYFQQIAARQGKQVFGLESVDMQIALLFGNDDQKQEALSLVETVSHREEGLQEIETLNALYKAGEIDRLVKMAQEQGDPQAMAPEEYDRMVDDRNLAWAEQLPDLMQARPCFIAVGAMHLGGEKGLIQLLKGKGYKVKPVAPHPLKGKKKSSDK